MPAFRPDELGVPGVVLRALGEGMVDGVAGAETTTLISLSRGSLRFLEELGSSIDIAGRSEILRAGYGAGFCFGFLIP